MAIRTRLTELLGIEHPISLGGMGSIHAPALAAEVSAAGGLGALGSTTWTADQVHAACREVRARTDRPFAANFLIFNHREEGLAAALEEKPPVIVFAWPRKDQALEPYFDRAHAAGSKVIFMAASVAEAKRAAAAGADALIAQGTEGGGHVSFMGTMALVPMVADACPNLPLMAAGGIADARGLAAALALGADGVLMGTRFLATEEAPLHASYKQAILDSDGHDTLLTEIPDLAAGLVWPGAMSRARRNRFIERWAGREWQIRHMQKEIEAAVAEARKRGDAEEAPLSFGQDAGLIRDIPKAGELVRRMAREAEEILRGRLAGMLG